MTQEELKRRASLYNGLSLTCIVMALTGFICLSANQKLLFWVFLALTVLFKVVQKIMLLQDIKAARRRLARIVSVD